MVRNLIVVGALLGAPLAASGIAHAGSSDDYGARQLFTADPPGTPEGRPLSSNAPDRTRDGRLVKKNHLSGEFVEFAINPDVRVGLNPYKRLLER